MDKMVVIQRFGPGISLATKRASPGEGRDDVVLPESGQESCRTPRLAKVVSGRPSRRSRMSSRCRSKRTVQCHRASNSVRHSGIKAIPRTERHR